MSLGILDQCKESKAPQKPSVGHHYGSYLEQPAWVEEAFRSPSGEEVQVLRLHKKHGNMLVSNVCPPRWGRYYRSQLLDRFDDAPTRVRRHWGSGVAPTTERYLEAAAQNAPTLVEQHPQVRRDPLRRLASSAAKKCPYLVRALRGFAYVSPLVPPARSVRRAREAGHLPALIYDQLFRFGGATGSL